MGLVVEELSGVEDVLGVEGIFEGSVKLEGGVAEGMFDPRFLGEADAVFAGDDAAVFEDPGEEEVEGGVGSFPDTRIFVVIDHEVGVDVTITSMAETGDGDAGLLLQVLSELDELDEFGARDDDVLVELGEAGVAEGVGEVAAELPNEFAG